MTPRDAIRGAINGLPPDVPVATGIIVLTVVVFEVRRRMRRRKEGR